MERALLEKLHVTNQDWARLPAFPNHIFCWFKRPLRLHGNGNTAKQQNQRQQRKSRNTVADISFVDFQHIISSHYMMWINDWSTLVSIIKNKPRELFLSEQWSVVLFVPSAICLLPSFSHSLFYLLSFFPPLWSLSALLRASTHIKWRAAVRFQFRTHLWCCRPPTRSAVAEGTQGSPITALYANALAPGQQRGHAGTGSLFMQISGRQSQHRAGHRHWWSYLPASTTAS